MEEEGTVCPECGLAVSYKWDNGFISEPHNVLIADWVLHSKCWDNLVDLLPTEEEDHERKRFNRSIGVCENL